MTKFFGRRQLLERIRELHQSSQHVSVVGARSIGKTALLEAVVAQHVIGSDLFAGAGIVDFRHDPPMSTAAALRRVGGVLLDIFKNATGGELKYLTDEIDLSASAEELYDQLKIALELVAEGERRVLLVLDGCDPVLQNSAIPRNLWDNLRALAQARSLRLMTGSRDHLHRLCYNPEARTSDFFRIFYDEPLVVGPFAEADWRDLHANCGFNLDASAQKELVNWTGGHPDLVDAVLVQLRELVRGGAVSKAEVDGAAEKLTAKAAARIDALWMDCPEETRGDIAQLIRGDVSATDIPAERLRYLVARGIATESGRKVRLANRFVERIAGARKNDVSGARKLFEKPDDFATNIRTVLELRLSQVNGGDAELLKLIRRALRHLPDEPDATLGGARDILDRALKLVWKAEAPAGKVPQEWIEHWKHIEAANGRAIKATADYTRNPGIPEERGLQCALVRLATGQQRISAAAKKVSKATYVALEHMNQVGDLKNHSTVDPTVTMAAAFCMTAIELCELLIRDLG